MAARSYSSVAHPRQKINNKLFERIGVYFQYLTEQIGSKAVVYLLVSFFKLVIWREVGWSRGSRCRYGIVL